MQIRRKIFELDDVPPMRSRAWVVLRQVMTTRLEPPEPDILELEEFVGIGTAAIELGKRSAAEDLDWYDLGIDDHRSGFESWGYSPADRFGDDVEALGIHLVIDQHIEEEGKHVWHLHHDLVVALGLLREDDVWYRPEESWIDVVRLKRNEDGNPVMIEAKREFLADYLCARRMALYCSSYRQRFAVTAADPGYGWPKTGLHRSTDRDRWEGLSGAIGYPYPSGTFRTQGALWRTEWVEPGKSSPRVRGDAEAHPISFVLETDGTRSTPKELQHALGWLYFNPTLVPALLRHRGSGLGWYSNETGSVGATANGLHFGINDLGLINVFAKDVGGLAAWEQRIWAAHNVTPDGGVSRELSAAQMEVMPAATVAPEKNLAEAVEALDLAFASRYGSKLLRGHADVPQLLRRANRFLAAEHDGLLELAKELNRLFAERIDVDAIMAALSLVLAKGDRKPGSLKALEKVVAAHRPAADARTMMAPLFGIYDLRMATAHLGSSLVESGLERAKVDDALPPTLQGRQLLQSFVDTMEAITEVVRR